MKELRDELFFYFDELKLWWHDFALATQNLEDDWCKLHIAVAGVRSCNMRNFGDGCSKLQPWQDLHLQVIVPATCNHSLK